ncbi:MAG: hypothetical protein ACK5XN_02385 [Bacteroidota bacterium]|jgi:type I restriction enzyme R subunit
MNESETRAEPIDPMLRNCGCGIMQDSGVARAFGITAGSIQAASRYRCEMNGYVQVYKDVKLVSVCKICVCRNVAVEKSILQLAYRVF